MSRKILGHWPLALRRKPRGHVTAVLRCCSALGHERRGGGQTHQFRPVQAHVLEFIWPVAFAFGAGPQYQLNHNSRQRCAL
eukprot:13190375-Alexandrium_andersonii.AAC.1